MRRRLARLMDGLREDAGTGDHMLELPGRLSVTRCYLDVESEAAGRVQQLGLYFFTADTLTQSRALYARPDAVERLLALHDDGWTLTPNMHLSFMSTEVMKTTVDKSPDDYARYWVSAIPELEQVRRGGFETFFERLVSVGCAAPDERDAFERSFTDTAREHVNPVPGLLCSFIWPFEAAERLDDTSGRFTTEVRKRIDEILVALGEPPLGWR